MIRFRQLDPDDDAALVHWWVTQPRARFWLMQGASVAEVRAAYREIDSSPYHEAFIGISDEVPSVLYERYDPAHSELAGVYDVQPGDVGMHFLVAPSNRPVHGFTRSVIRAVMDHCFADASTQRVVVEPDADNTAVHALNADVGFVVDREVELPTKRALLSFCTRDDYRGWV